MRSVIAAATVLLLLGACERRADTETGARTDNDRTGVDTSIQSSTVRDTTVIQADTNIDVDTIEKTDNIEKTRE
jgi:hypothetical protein